jgi:hypothetical protein
MELNNTMRAHLDATRKWAMFLAIVGFVMMSLLVVFGFSFGAIMRTFSGDAQIPGFPGFMVGIVYLFIAVIYFFPLLYLFRFARLAKKGIHEYDRISMESAFSNLRAHYTYIGILMAITIGLYVIGGVIFAVAMFFMQSAGSQVVAAV